MQSEDKIQRVRMLRADLHAWTALHHLVPAGLARELAAATVEACELKLTFGDLFEDNLTGSGVADTWSILPKEVDGKLSRYLQQHIRVLAWGNDSETYPQIEKDDEGKNVAEQLSWALQLGRLDLGCETWALDRLKFAANSSASLLREAIRIAVASQAQGAIAWREVEGCLLELPHPLRAMALKHIGDLSGDADAWEDALQLYESAEAACREPHPLCWRAFTRDFIDIVSQSRAMALWITRGAVAAASRLSTQLSQSASPSRLATLNGAHDSLVARLEADEGGSWRDLRSATLMPPLLLHSHGVSSAVGSWQSGEYENAYKAFWATLRRQIALGSYSESRDTKALYGRALLDQVAQLQPTRALPHAFELGARLLVESGRARGLQALRFPTETVGRYVSGKLVEHLAQVSDRHEGARQSRGMVLITLLANWAEASPVGQEKISSALMGELIARTLSHGVDFHTSKNLGGEGLKLLRSLAAKRPDLRRRFAVQVAELIVQKLDDRGWWTGTSESLELALAYLDVFEPEPLRAVLVAALKALHTWSPELEMSPIVQPALRLLSSEAALRVASADPELGPNYVSSLLRYGIAQRSAGAGLLFALSRFRDNVRLSTDDQAALDQLVGEVRAGARQFNSSSVTDYIRALLLAAPRVGLDGVRDAIDGLVHILRSVGSGGSRIAFPYAYGPVLDLIEVSDDLPGIKIPDSEIRDLCVMVEDALIVAWEAIIADPVLLADFSLPPKQHPNPTLVHNWAFATRRFIARWGDGVRLAELLEQAATIPVLSSRMNSGVLSASDLDQLAEGELQNLQTESAESFYAAIGRRLHIAQDAPRELRISLLRVLIEKCLEFGPNDLDVAVFMLATPYRTDLEINFTSTDYIRKAQLDWNLVSNLNPFLKQWLT